MGVSDCLGTKGVRNLFPSKEGGRDWRSDKAAERRLDRALLGGPIGRHRGAGVAGRDVLVWRVWAYLVQAGGLSATIAFEFEQGSGIGLRA